MSAHISDIIWGNKNNYTLMQSPQILQDKGHVRSTTQFILFPLMSVNPLISNTTLQILLSCCHTSLIAKTDKRFQSINGIHQC